MGKGKQEERLSALLAYFIEELKNRFPYNH